MRVEGSGDREHGVVDLLVLLAAVCLALGTWSSLSAAGGAMPWKCYGAVSITLLFALAALTRHPHWAAAIRFVMGMWLIVAPYLLKFADIAPVLWTCLLTGGLVTMLSIPGIAAPHLRRIRMAV